MFRLLLLRFKAFFLFGTLSFSGATAAECISQSFTNLTQGVLKEARDMNIFRLNVAVRVAAAREINAFALPSGQVVFTSELLKVFETDAEYFSILFHEIGHLSLEHLKKDNRTLLIDLLGSGLGDLVRFYVEGKNSQENEKEADRFAAMSLSRMGFDPKVMINVLIKIDRTPSDLNRTLFGTHPDRVERIKELSSYISKLPKKDYRPSTPFLIRDWSCKT